MEKITDKQEEQRVAIQRSMGRFRIWFSLVAFFLCAITFTLGFPALEDAGRKVGLGVLSYGLPFGLDLGMVTLLLWSLWNRAALKAWWPPMVPAAGLLILSSWLQYIHASSYLEDKVGLEHWGLLVLSLSIPFLLALTAGVFEAVTFAPLIDRGRQEARQAALEAEAAQELWKLEQEDTKKRLLLEAQLRRTRMEAEAKQREKFLEAEGEARTRAMAEGGVVPQPVKKVVPRAAPPKTGTTSPAVVQEAVNAVLSGELSQRAAAEKYGVARTTLRRQLEARS